VGRPGPGGTDGNACLDGVAGTLSPTADMSYVNTRSTSRITRESLASYGTLTYHAVPTLELTAGARLSVDRIAQNSGTFRFITNSTFAPYAQPGSTYYGNPCTYANIDSALCSGRLDYQSPGFPAGQEGSYGVVFTDQTYKAHKFTWKLGASWKPRADTVIYANVATGYKPGGFNPPSGFTEAPCCYKAENLVSYEVGIKARALDWLRVDSTAFYYNYGDQQVVSTIEIGNANFTSVTANASSRIWGVENLLTATPTRQDRIGLGINYLHAAFRDLQAGGNAGNAFVDWSGVTLDKAPRWTISADYRHTFDIGSHGRIDVGVNTRYTSEYYLNVISNAQRYRQKPFHRTGADVTWTTQSGNFWLQGFVSNIEDKVQETFYQGNPSMIGNGNVGITEPRFYGLRLGTRF
jgi:iron complex outermembrane receptor protein